MGKILNLPHWHGGYTGNPHTPSPGPCGPLIFSPYNKIIQYPATGTDLTGTTSALNQFSETYTLEIYGGLPTGSSFMNEGTVSTCGALSVDIAGIPQANFGWGYANRQSYTVAPSQNIVIKLTGGYTNPTMWAWSYFAVPYAYFNDGIVNVATVNWSCGAGYGTVYIKASLLGQPPRFYP